MAGGWASHFAGRVEQLVSELLNTRSSQLGVRIGTVVQIKATIDSALSRK
jgi:hypothetical protein